jgi:hypothetical protein
MTALLIMNWALTIVACATALALILMLRRAA